MGLNTGSLLRGANEEPRDERPTLAEAGIDKKLSSLDNSGDLLNRAAGNASKGAYFVARFAIGGRCGKFPYLAALAHPFFRRLFLLRQHCPPDRINLARQEVLADGVLCKLAFYDVVQRRDRDRDD
ncbi:hypothetical protein [Pelagibius sp. Alg239-R121]|uniref:hypothetical protein n=1 Tax=Pelagibius sp. Alg239-R121 TaxID=2993448 RepID=UPI0024A736D6|nr:hypothetical protein [Pelagibius sp. Alg239-R121]